MATRGTRSFNGTLIRSPLEQGFLFLRNSATGEERWLYASAVEPLDGATDRFAGEVQVAGATCTFQVSASLPEDIQSIT
jgi:hypothetical protein